MHIITVTYGLTQFIINVIFKNGTIHLSCNTGNYIEIKPSDIIENCVESKKLIRKLLRDCGYNMQIFVVLMHLLKEIINSYESRTVEVNKDINLRFNNNEMYIINDDVQFVKIPKGREIINWNLKEVFKGLVSPLPTLATAPSESACNLDVDTSSN